MVAAFRNLVLLAALVMWSGLIQAQESTEPPVPRAAPRGMVSEEVLPRAGGVLVFGGTRGAGLEAVKELVKRGEKVTVMARASSDTAALKTLGVNIVPGDALVNEDIVKAFAAAPYRVVVSALGGKDDNWRVDVDGNRLVAEGAKSAKIPRMIMVSAIGAGDSAEARPWYLQPFMKEFIAAKSKAEDNLRASGVVFTIVRFGRLVDKPSSGAAVLSEDHAAFSAITRADAG
ncbi:MAG: NAD(P)-dependent oxidoreductase, partial [Rhodospirillaceae bacterium]